MLRDEFRREYLVRLPLPIAQLYGRAFNAKSPRERHDNAFYLFEAIVKLAASTATAFYLEEASHSRAGRKPQLDRLLAQLALPSLGQWLSILRELNRHFASRVDAAGHPWGEVWEQLSGPRNDCPALLALYRRIKNGPDGEPAGDRACSLLNVLDALVQYRNAVFGHGAGRFESFFADEMGPLLFPAINEALADGKFSILGPKDARLVYLAEIRKMDDGRTEVGLRELVGTQGERVAPLELTVIQSATLLPNRVGLLWPGRTVPLRLDPLLQYRESELSEEVLFLNRDRNGKQVEYLSYTTGRTERDRSMLPALAELLSRVTNHTVSEAELRQLSERSLTETPSVESLFEPKLPDSHELGEYELLSELGRGGMGVVYLARQSSLGRLVALKMLPHDLAADEVALARFRREIRNLAGCDDPHVIKILSSGTFPDGRLYYTMEYVPGSDLEMVWRELSGTFGPAGATTSSMLMGRGTWTQAVLSASRKQREKAEGSRGRNPASTSGAAPRVEVPSLAPLPLPPLPNLPDADDDPGGFVRHVVTLARDVAKALQSIHDQGMVHRDIKPANLMLTPDGARIVLMDFGLAKMQTSSLAASRQGGLLGTLRYAAPEQLAAANIKVGPAVDVRGLGATIWELLTRQRLFGAAEDEARLTQEVLMSDVPRLRSIDARFDRDLDAIVARATERRLSDRIQTAGQLAELLQMWLDGKPLPIRLPTLRELAWRWVREHAAIATAASLLLIMALITGGVILRSALQRHQQSQQAWQQVAQQSRQLMENTLPGISGELRQTDVDIEKLHALLPAIEQQATAIRHIAEEQGLAPDARQRAIDKAAGVDKAVSQLKLRIKAVERLLQARVLRFQITDEAFRISDGLPVTYGRDALSVYRAVLSELAGRDVLGDPDQQGEIANSLRAHDITDHLRRALDDWFVLSYGIDEQPVREQLAALAELLDAGDEQSARSALRRAIIAHDVQALQSQAIIQLQSARMTSDGFHTGLLLVDGLLENLQLDLATDVLRKLREAGSQPDHVISQFGRCWADLLCGVVLNQIGSREELHEAIQCFEAAAAIDPSLDVVRLNVAMAHWSLARPLKSIELLKHVRDPKLDKIRRVYLGFALAQCGRAREAREIARTLLTDGRDSVLACHGAAVIFGQLLDHEAAQQAAQAGLRLDPHHPSLLWLAYDPGSSALREALAKVPTDRRQRFWLAQVMAEISSMRQGINDQDLHREESAREILRQLGVRSWKLSWIDYAELLSFQNWGERAWETTLRELHEQAPSILAEQVPNPMIARDGTMTNEGVRQMLLREAEYAASIYPPSQYRRLLASANLLQYVEPKLAASFYEAALRRIPALRDLEYGSASDWSELETAITDKIRWTADPEAMDEGSAKGKRTRANAYWHIGQAKMRTEDFRTAREYIEKYLTLAEELATENPDDLTARGNVSRAYAALSEVSIRAGDLDSANRFAQKDLENAESMTRDAHGNPAAQLVLARAYFKMATLEESRGQNQESHAHLDQAVAIYQRHLAMTAADVRVQDYLLNCYQKQGELHLKAGDYQAAMASFQQCLPIVEQRSKAVPNSFVMQRDLARLNISLGRTCMFQRLHAQALEYFQKARGLVEPFLSSMPGQPLVLDSVAEIYPYLAMASSLQADRSAAREYRDKHVALRRQLLALQPENETNLQILASALGSGRESPLEDAQRQLQDLDEAIRLSPAVAESWYQRGNVRYWLNELDRAYEDFSAAIRLDPNNAKYFHARGETLYWQNKVEQSVEEYSAAIRLEPRQAEYYHSRGVALTWLTRFQEAIEDLDAALSINKDDPAVWSSRAVAMARMGRYQQSEADFSQAFKLAPDKASLYRERGYARGLLSHFQEAEQDYNKAIELEPQDPAHWAARGSFYDGQSRWKDALADVEQLLRLDPNNADYRNLAGQLRLKLGDAEGALQMFSSAMEQDPEHFSAHRHVALTLAAQRQWDRARQEYDLCMERAHCFPQSWVEAALIARRQHDDPRTESLQSDMLQRFWSDPVTANADAVGWASARFAIPDQKPVWERFLSQWAANDDGSPLTLRTQAALQYRLEQWQAAEASLRKWIALPENGADPRGLLFLTMSLAKQRKLDQARVTLEAAKAALQQFEQEGGPYTSADGKIKWIPVEESGLLLAEAEATLDAYRD